jgi:hypothetical protein
MLKLIGCILFATLYTSCAHQKEMEKHIEKEIKQESFAKEQDVIEAAREYITKSSNLSERQKISLFKIEEKVVAETSALRVEINKTRMVLLKSAFEPNFNSQEVNMLKNKILKLERKKSSIGFNAFVEARNVLDPVQIEDNRLLNIKMMNQNNYPF